MEEKIAQIIAGDQEAFSEMYNLYCNKVYSIAFSIVKDEFEAEDVMQEIFISLPEKLKTLKNPKRFESWLYTMARNKSIDFFRKRKNVNFSDMGYEDDEYIFEDTLQSEYKDFQPEETLDYTETKEIINNIINSLPEEQQECVNLRWMKGFSLQEIADKTGVPLATVKSRLKYGKSKIEAEVKALEKNGVKLYGVSGLALLPFLRWMLSSGQCASATLCSSTSVATASSTAAAATIGTGTVGAGAVATSTAVAGTTAASTAATTAIGTGTIVAVAKSAIAVVATVAVIGTATVTVENLTKDVVAESTPVVSVLNTPTTNPFITQEPTATDNLLSGESIADVICFKEVDGYIYYSEDYFTKEPEYIKISYRIPQITNLASEDVDEWNKNIIPEIPQQIYAKEEISNQNINAYLSRKFDYNSWKVTNEKCSIITIAILNGLNEYATIKTYYYFDVKTGNSLSQDDLLTIAGLSQEHIEQKITDGISAYFSEKRKESEDIYSQDCEQRSIENYSENIKYFYNDAGIFCASVNVFVNASPGVPAITIQLE